MPGKSFVSQVGVVKPKENATPKSTPIDESTQTFGDGDSEESKGSWCPSGPESFFREFGNLTDPLKGRNR